MRIGTESNHKHSTRANIGTARLYKRRTTEPFSLGSLREIEHFKFINHECGATLPDDDFGIDVLREVLNQFALNGATPDQLREWGRDLLPGLDDDDSLDDLIKEIGTGRKRRADDVARALGINYQLRTLLDLRTIGACDISKAKRKAISDQKRAADKRWKREKAGAKPQAKSARRTKPWEAEGISQSTYYARKKRAAANAKNGQSEHFGTHTLSSFPWPKRSDPEKTELEPGASVQASIPPQPSQCRASFYSAVLVRSDREYAAALHEVSVVIRGPLDAAASARLAELEASIKAWRSQRWEIAA
jgi:hypothetical protein